MESTPIAIVGVSCRFANAADPGEFWRLIMHQKSGIGPLGMDTALLPGVRNLFDRPYPTHGGLLGRLYACVPGDQNFPRQINKGENQDLYFAVQMAFDALVDAGMRPRSRESQRGTVRFGYAPPIVVAPAMNTGMYLNTATQVNFQTLKARGVAFVEMGDGELACGTTGVGRMADPSAIVAAVDTVCGR